MEYSRFRNPINQDIVESRILFKLFISLNNLRQLGDGPTKPPLKLLAGYGLGKDAERFIRFGNSDTNQLYEDGVFVSDDEDIDATNAASEYDPLMDPTNPVHSTSLWIGFITETTTEEMLRDLFSNDWERIMLVAEGYHDYKFTHYDGMVTEHLMYYSRFCEKRESEVKEYTRYDQQMFLLLRHTSYAQRDSNDSCISTRITPENDKRPTKKGTRRLRAAHAQTALVRARAHSNPIPFPPKHLKRSCFSTGRLHSVAVCSLYRVFPALVMHA
uniref:Uncharacterized protein n=1 Tax=Timema tahoe TaxID=61484 RepID=A0A7R9FKB8_9NEOP|nr:unnamed protein product [Timema tahoe]